ncbi:MAG: HlyD family efflux transporter periplasmic adaptor subunit [Magnetococcales bacterium]|nr:HlyD family efflux transporter periplasmic adaptor subunit [Magnetococcales bacterium]
MAGSVNSQSLPPLREELHLYSGPRASDGSPTKTIWDPQTNNYYRIGWLEFEILIRWQIGSAEKIAQAVSAQTTLTVHPGQVESLSRFLSLNSLLRPPQGESVDRFTKLAAVKKHWLIQILHSYIFFRLPVVNPDNFLKNTLPSIRWLFSATFLKIILICTFLDFYLVSQRWDSFVYDASSLTSASGLFYLGVALILTKAVHELGHAYTARYFGCHVPTIGIAFLMLWPLLYTDTSDTWKLPSRWERMAVGAAGMLAESILAIVATLAWAMLLEGPLRSTLFFIAVISFTSTLLLNLSPLLRLDGYYLLSDWLNIANLHERAANLGRWYLREALFGLDETPPELYLYDKHKFLILFAYFTWIYRFFLMIGIALVVYIFFFKLLGIILMAVEIGWFIALPIIKELRIWRGPRVKLRWNIHTIGFATLFIGSITLFILPFSTKIDAPALLRRDDHTILYAPMPAQIKAVHVANGDTVWQEHLLIELNSPKLEQLINRSRLKRNLSKFKLDNGEISQEFKDQRQVLKSEYAADLSQYEGLLQQKEKLNVISPIYGKVVSINENLQVGEWVEEHTQLLELANLQYFKVVSYIKDVDFSLIHMGANANFYPEGTDLPPIKCWISKIATVPSDLLDEPSLASTNGGKISVKLNKQGQPVPSISLYRVELIPFKKVKNNKFIMRGTVVIKGNESSMLSNIWKMAMAVFMKESGF